MNVLQEQGWGSVKGLEIDLINLINISRPTKIFIDTCPMCNSKDNLVSFQNYAYGQMFSDVVPSIIIAGPVVSLKSQIEKKQQFFKAKMFVPCFVG